MQGFTRGCVVLITTLASACSGSNGATPASPTPAPAPTPPTAPPATIVLTGQITDWITSAAISGATVSINGRHATVTDGAGNYSVTGLLDAGRNFDTTYVSAANYAGDTRYIRGTSQNVRLHRIERITAGGSWSVTIAPDDTLCSNNVQDTPGLGPDYVCRSVRVVAPGDGLLTLEAVSAQGGARPLLEVEIVGGSAPGPCCSERLENPTSIRVIAGTQVIANIEMASGSTSSQSFTLTTSLRPQ